jgi:hypothetical protein
VGGGKAGDAPAKNRFFLARNFPANAPTAAPGSGCTEEIFKIQKPGEFRIKFCYAFDLPKDWPGSWSGRVESNELVLPVREAPTP